MMRTSRRWIALFAVLLLARPAAADPATEAKVTYLTSTTVYLDAGTEAGLREGDVVKVFRDGVFVTALEVTALSSRRASCRRADPSAEIRVGDRVRFRTALEPTPVAPALDPALASDSGSAAASRSAGTWLRDHRLRGRIGLRYLGVFDRSGFGEDFSQPALDLRVQSDGLGHPALQLAADVRARRTYHDPVDGASSREGLTRVYRLAAEWNAPGDGFRTVFGRQAATALTAIGIFDGITAEYEWSGWSAGAFTGSQPDESHFGFSRHIVEHGAYVEWRGRAGVFPRWRLTTGIVGSYADGEINRENLVFQGRYSGERLFASAIQDVDINRGWKRDAGESALSATSSFATARYRVTDAVTVDAGFDNRRSVRLYRDRITPETEFDDSYRQGTWGGLDYTVVRGTRVGLHVRRTAGGSSGSARSATFTARSGVARFHNLGANLRSTAYRSDTVEGWLHSAGAGADLGDRLHLELGGGLRDETDRVSSLRRNDLHWISVDLDVRMTRTWVLLLSGERSDGEEEKNSQIYASALYRF